MNSPGPVGMKQRRNEAVESVYEKMIMIQHEISAV